MDLSNQIRVFLTEITLADMMSRLDTQELAKRQEHKRVQVISQLQTH